MLAEFVVVSFAAFIGYQVFRMWLPFIPVNAYIAPIWALAIAAGFTALTGTGEGKTKILIAVASTGGVALLNKITDVTPPEPFKLSLSSLSARRKVNRSTQSAPRERIPSL